MGSFKKFDNAVKKVLGLPQYSNPVDDFVVWGRKLDNKLNAPVTSKKKGASIREPIPIDDAEADKEDEFE